MTDKNETPKNPIISYSSIQTDKARLLAQGKTPILLRGEPILPASKSLQESVQRASPDISRTTSRELALRQSWIGDFINFRRFGDKRLHAIITQESLDVNNPKYLNDDIDILSRLSLLIENTDFVPNFYLELGKEIERLVQDGEVYASQQSVSLVLESLFNAFDGDSASMRKLSALLKGDIEGSGYKLTNLIKFFEIKLPSTNNKSDISVELNTAFDTETQYVDVKSILPDESGLLVVVPTFCATALSDDNIHVDISINPKIRAWGEKLGTHLLAPGLRLEADLIMDAYELIYDLIPIIKLIESNSGFNRPEVVQKWGKSISAKLDSIPGNTRNQNEKLLMTTLVKMITGSD